MKKSILSYLVGLCFIRLSITPDSEGNTQNPEGKSDVAKMPQEGGKVPVTVDWRTIGARDASEVKTLEGRALTFTKKVLLQRAAELGGNPLITEDYLQGFSSQYGASAKQRKREVKAIFDAYTMQNVERVVKITAEVKDEHGKVTTPGEILKETHSGKEWLEKFEGGYGELVKLATEVRGKKPGGNTGPATRALTDTVVTEMGKSARERMKPEQAASLIQDAVTGITLAKSTSTGEASEKLLGTTIMGIARRLMQSSHEGIRSKAGEILLKAEALVSEAEKIPKVGLPAPAPMSDKTPEFAAPQPEAAQKVA